MNKKFTKTEKSWMFYDWANSVFATTMMAAIFPIYFASVCKSYGQNSLVLLPLGTSIATFTVAILAPFLGSVASNKGFKKPMFMFFMALGVLFTGFCAITNHYMGLLVGYILSYIGFCGANLFYDSFLTDVTTEDRMDRVSAWGYAMGYLGGSTIPFLVSIAILLIMGMDNLVAIKITIVIASVWWLAFSIPFVKNVKQIHYVEKNTSNLIKTALLDLVKTFKLIVKNKKMLYFMLAYFFFIDGVGTVISVSTSYGSVLGLDATGMILALLVTQLVAVPCSILFGKISTKVGSIKMITSAIMVYIAICILGFFMGNIVETDPENIATAQTLFWVLACFVGTVQGGIQALSRSFFGKLVPPERSSEYFGFFDIFGKFAAVIGPALVSAVTYTTGKASLGVLSLIVLFILGLVFLAIGKKYFVDVK